MSSLLHEDLNGTNGGQSSLAWDQSLLVLTSDVRETVGQLQCDGLVSGILQLVVAEMWHTIELGQNDS